MNTSRNYLIGIGSVVVLYALGIVMDAHRVAAQPPRATTPVEIVGPLPVPMTGTVGVTGTPNVNVVNTPSVNINGTPTVSVNNLPATQAVNIASDTTGLTHVRRPASDLVTLLAPNEDQVGFFTRLLPDVTFEAAQPRGYTPPIGKVLVVTDFSYNFTMSARPNENISVTLSVDDPSATREAIIVYSTALSDASGHLGTSVHLTTGFVLKAGATLRTLVPVNASIQGYLVDDK